MRARCVFCRICARVIVLTIFIRSRNKKKSPLTGSVIFQHAELSDFRLQFELQSPTVAPTVAYSRAYSGLQFGLQSPTVAPTVAYSWPNCRRILVGFSKIMNLEPPVNQNIFFSIYRCNRTFLSNLDLWELV